MSAQNFSLEVSGGRADLNEMVAEASLLAQGESSADARPRPQDVIASARADYGRIVSALYSEGYFAPQVSVLLDGREAASLSPFARPDAISDVRIFVDPGPQFTFSDAQIGPVAPGTDLPEEFRAGGQASTRVLQNATEATILGWRAQGHALAEVARQDLRANAGAATISADITVAPGPPITFGALRPQGQQSMRPDRIVEIAGLPTGLLFSPAELDRAAARLRETGVFSSVALVPADTLDGTVMPIDARLVEAPLRRFGFGAELSTDSGGEVSAFWLHRNLFGGAERFRAEGRLSGIGQGEISPDTIEGVDAEFRARLTRPATFGPDTAVHAEVFALGLDEPSFREIAFGAELGARRTVSPELEYGIGLGFMTTAIEDAFGDRRSTLLSVPAEATWDNRDDPLDATRGIYTAAAAQPFVTDTGDVGLRWTLDARGYLSFGAGDGTVLAARFQAGSLMGGEIDTLPADFLFWSGGAGTVRGQDYASLGALQNGMDSGGRGFLGLSGEVRQQIGETAFSIVGFADVGLISSDALWQGDSDVHAGIGIGVRYDTGIGPIRLDLGTPLGNGDTGDEWFLYIGIGQSF